MTAALPRPFRVRLILVYLFLGLFNAGAWIWAVMALGSSPVLLGAALAVYGLGLRHALDADHIAAIDNVTRRLMLSGARPVTTGLFFALGHSAMVVAVTAAIASSSTALGHLARFRDAGGFVATAVSAGFLLLVGVLNLRIFGAILRSIRQPSGAAADPVATGPLARLLAPLLALVDRNWLMFPLGFLFGLGFDTASEVALFGVSAAHASAGLPFGAIMVFPALFAAGMALVDTTDGVMMVGAYDWALLNPQRKLYYNLAITALSVAIAFAIAALEIASLGKANLAADNGIRQLAHLMGENMNLIGMVIAALFLVCWLVSTLGHRRRRLSAVDLAPALVVAARGGHSGRLTCRDHQKPLHTATGRYRSCAERDCS